MADMKKIIIDGVEYEIIDASVRLRMTDAEANITDLQTGKADSADIPSNTSDLTNDAGFITEVPVEGVTIDGTSIVSGKIAAIPRATDTRAGVVKIDPFTEEGTQYLDIYAEKDNGAEKENRVPLLDANNKILAAQLPAATTSTQGALSAEDKQQLSGLTNALFGKVDKEEGKGLSTIDYTQNDKVKLDSVEAGAQVNTVTGIKGNSEGSYRTGQVNLTAANVGAAASSHTHDDRYYTESEMDTKLSGKAASSHTHTLSIATDSGTNKITLAASTKYKLTAGGSTYIFTTPPNTTYSSKAAASGGTAVSLVTTGEKYTWNNKAAGNHTHTLTTTAATTGTQNIGASATKSIELGLSSPTGILGIHFSNSNIGIRDFHYSSSKITVLCENKSTSSQSFTMTVTYTKINW